MISKSTLTVLVVCCTGCATSARAMPFKNIKGCKTKPVRFPSGVKHRLLKQDEAKRRFRQPKLLKLEVAQATVSKKQIRLSALLHNQGATRFDVVVHPYGGTFPYGGDNPLVLRFARSALSTVKYSGELFPPEPPQPMLIELPARVCVQFDAKIDLGMYRYSGSPSVAVEWSFSYFDGTTLKGTKTVKLPRR